MKCQIAPSILSFPLSRVFTPVQEMISAGVEVIHFDLMDGQFVPPITFGDSLIQSLRPAGDAVFEAHLMTETPERHFEAMEKAGCSRIIFHAEATNHAYRLIQSLKDRNIEAGIAINPGTPVSAVEEILDIADLVLVMTVNPGWGGQALIESCLKKVSAIRELAPNIHIEVDGGIDADTLPKAKAAGANLFVVGSYLAKQKDLSSTVRHLNSLCD